MMRCCKWCGEPLDEGARQVRYHKGRCDCAAHGFRSFLGEARHAYKHENFATHERLYWRFFKKITDTPPHMPCQVALGIEEWFYMTDLVVAMDECDIPYTTRNGPRLRELAEIANTILSMKDDFIYSELPRETRELLTRYTMPTMRYWSVNPQDTLRKEK